MEDYTRREIMKMSVGTFIGLVAALPQVGCFAKRANGYRGFFKKDEPLNWDAFLSKIDELAKTQFQPRWDEDIYVDQVAQVLQRIDIYDPALKKFYDSYKNKRKNFPDIKDIHRQREFQISLLHFEQGEIINPHNHPSMTGALLCATGELDVKNYDVITNQKAKKRKLLQTTQHEIMQPGIVSTLTSKKRNIHRIAANSFSQVIDVFTPPYNRERAVNTKWFKIDKEPFQGQKDLYEII